MEAEINSFYAACLFAIAGFDQLKAKYGDGVKRTFIAGGNACPWLPAHDIFLTLFVGKVRSIALGMMIICILCTELAIGQRAQSYLMEYFSAKLSPKTGHQFYFAYQVRSLLSLPFSVPHPPPSPSLFLYLYLSPLLLFAPSSSLPLCSLLFPLNLKLTNIGSTGRGQHQPHPS